LLLVRQEGRDGQTTWQLPQGLVPDGASAEDTVVRETLRIAGMTVQALRTLGGAPDGSSGRTTVYVACKPVDDASFTVTLENVGEHEWCGQAELLHRLSLPFVDRSSDTSTRPAGSTSPGGRTIMPTNRGR
jgi:ADP-ribose pyrophosphatase YjhB (NUDIX family)